MTSKARFVLVGGGGPDEGKWIGPMAKPVKGFLLSPFVSQEFVMLLADITTEDLNVMKQLIAAKKVTPVIDRTYTLQQVPEAIRYLEDGHARGKVVITVERDDQVSSLGSGFAGLGARLLR
jgi:NADPH:quinone reductase-like Zn-dependent oxidoreductase